MRVKRRYILSNTESRPSDVEDLIYKENIVFDSNDTVDKRMAIAIQRFMSHEARSLFGSTLRFPGHDLYYVNNKDKQSYNEMDYIGEWRLDLKKFDLCEKGKCMLQSPSVFNFELKYGPILSTTGSNTFVVIRDIDTSYDRAVMDAYLLGDGRLKFAISKALTSNVTVPKEA